VAPKYLLKLDYFSKYIISVIPINILELLAAIAGTYYLKKVAYLKSTKYLVIFLWITIFIELISSYPAIAYFSEYKYFSFIKDTPYENNYWLFNLFIIFSIVFYIYYFRSFLKGKNWKLLLKILSYLYVLSSIVNLLFTDIYFKGYSQFTTITGTLLLFLSIVVFYFELLKSDELLNIKRFLPLYISIGVLIFYLCITPINIFSEYFGGENNFYIQLKANVYLYANIFLYSTYILGFIICSNEKRSY